MKIYASIQLFSLLLVSNGIDASHASMGMMGSMSTMGMMGMMGRKSSDDLFNKDPKMGTFDITVRVENLAPPAGVCLTPVWVGVHDGSFDTYDRGVSVSIGMERTAEDGNNDLLSADFAATAGNVVDGNVMGPGPLCPPLPNGVNGATMGPRNPNMVAVGTTNLSVDVVKGTPLYFSYASMIIPSNDFFISNGNPKAFLLFDHHCRPQTVNFIVGGNGVLDAGSEVSDEAVGTVAFFDQGMANVGADQNEGVSLAADTGGFLMNGPILADPAFAAADFLAEGYEVARITVTVNSGKCT